MSGYCKTSLSGFFTDDSRFEEIIEKWKSPRLREKAEASSDIKINNVKKLTVLLATNFLTAADVVEIFPELGVLSGFQEVKQAEQVEQVEQVSGTLDEKSKISAESGETITVKNTGKDTVKNTVKDTVKNTATEPSTSQKGGVGKKVIRKRKNESSDDSKKKNASKKKKTKKMEIPDSPDSPDESPESPTL